MQIKRRSFSDPATVATAIHHLIGEPMQEEVWVLYLDTKNRCVDVRMISRGAIDRATCSPRDVFRHAFGVACSRIIMAHNHPSGDNTPSSADIKITTMLIDAGQLLDIQLLDHVVLGHDEDGGVTHHSMREKLSVVFA